jgi:hypothetical protein
MDLSQVRKAAHIVRETLHPSIIDSSSCSSSENDSDTLDNYDPEVCAFAYIAEKKNLHVKTLRQLCIDIASTDPHLFSTELPAGHSNYDNMRAAAIETVGDLHSQASASASAPASSRRCYTVKIKGSPVNVMAPHAEWRDKAISQPDDKKNRHGGSLFMRSMILN